MSRRKELLSPAISKYRNENRSATTPAVPITRKDVPSPAPGVSNYHIENGKAVATTMITTTDPRPLAQTLAARRKDMLAECFWSRDRVVDKDECLAGYGDEFRKAWEVENCWAKRAMNVVMLLGLDVRPMCSRC